MIKWIPDAMVILAQEAVRRVREMTTEARRIASWLENNPDRFYRHIACPYVSENEPLSIQQTAVALGESHPGLGYTRAELRRFGLPDRDGENSLATLNQWVHKGLPNDFPWFDKERGVRFSEALFCLRQKQLRTDMPASVFMINHNIIEIGLNRYAVSLNRDFRAALSAQLPNEKDIASPLIPLIDQRAKWAAFPVHSCCVTLLTSSGSFIGQHRLI